MRITYSLHGIGDRALGLAIGAAFGWALCSAMMPVSAADAIHATANNITLSGEININTIQVGPGQTITFEPGATIGSRLVISSSVPAWTLPR